MIVACCYKIEYCDLKRQCNVWDHKTNVILDSFSQSVGKDGYFDLIRVGDFGFDFKFEVIKITPNLSARYNTRVWMVDA